MTHKNIFKIMILFCFGVLVLISCELDNYDAPNAGIKGNLLVEGTDIGFQVDFRPKVRLLEIKYGDNALPMDINILQDGTFQNTEIFGGEYQIVPLFGAFSPVEAVTVNIQGVTEVNFNVVPYLIISASAQPESGGVQVTYKLSRSEVIGKIKEAIVLVSEFSWISNTTYDFSTKRTFSNSDSDETILATEYTDSVTGLESGKTYFVRVAALAANSGNYYNYSPIMKVTIP